MKGALALRIAIVDDDRAMYDRLKIYLGELLADAFDLLYYPSGEAFLAAWKPQAFDLVILDIFMDRITGMETAREIRRTDRDVKLVFCTTSNEFASESYEVNACYYLHKPFDRERIKAMLDRIDLTQIEKRRVVQLPDGTSAVLRDILYADCAAHCVTLHNKRGEDTVVRTAFAQIEALLCAYPYFVSPTKGVVVNLYEVTAQSGDTFILSDGSRIPISRRKARETIDAYSAFRFDQLRKGGGE